ncbi:hypothetical protein B5S28_g1676 [[Candida] boidinii]|nr:hypothetical protein B5S28_g1676 [[Candida] boidinii]OWB61992.1 hypothetical protein B5S29_g2902 [[Candida] boidinii]GME87033.1 unnamed protein product [[Candida] boidinii]
MKRSFESEGSDNKFSVKRRLETIKKTQIQTQTPIDKKSNVNNNIKSKVAEAKARIAAKRLQEQKDQETKKDDKHRNDNTSIDGSTLASIEIHPLLRGDSSSAVSGNSGDVQLKKIANPLKNTGNSSGSNNRQYGTFNPYIDQNDFSIAPPRPKRQLLINEKGKYIERANKIREKIAKEKEEKEKYEELKSKGLVANEIAGEQFFNIEEPPKIEWWDRKLVTVKNYDHIDEPNYLTYKEATDHLEEGNPITEFIQHPVPIRAPWEKHLGPMKPLYLTKEERKRMRKLDRAKRHKEKQDRIRVGLDPVPEPKVKLKNLMNVLTNQAIKNPTEVEMKVKSDIENRRLLHEKTNEERKLTIDQRHEKIEIKKEKDLSKGFFFGIFKVDRLVNPQHIYKLDINAKQLGLFGGILNLKNGFSVVIIEGSFKAVEKYKNLVHNRIEWTVNVAPKKKTPLDQDGDEILGDSEGGAPIEEEEREEQVVEDLSNNKCTELSEGQLKDLHFNRWKIINFETHQNAMEYLSKYKLDNYWRQAVTE